MMSRRPKAVSAAPITPRHSPPRVTSARTNSALPPAVAISPATRSPPAALTSFTTTRAPSCAKRFAMPSPNPEPAPVTMATFPVSLMTPPGVIPLYERANLAFERRVFVQLVDVFRHAARFPLQVVFDRGGEKARAPPGRGQ